MPTKSDPFANVRKQAQRALDAVHAEIRRREADLQKLVAQAEQWQAAITGTKPTPGNGRPRKKATTKPASAKKKSGGKRVSWDGVLKGLPKTFSVDDVMKRPGVKAKGRAQVYPSLTRWMDAKKIKRVGKGKYQKL